MADAPTTDFEQRHKLLSSQVSDAVIIADAESGLIVEWNDRALDLLGYSAEELPTVRGIDLLASPNRDEIRQRLREVIEPDQNQAFRSPLQRRDGQIRQLDVRFTKSLLEGRWVYYILLRDISWEVEARRMLIQTGDHVDEARRLAGMAAWEWNLKTGAVTWSNPAGAFGIIPDEGAYQSIEEFYETVDSADRERVRAAYQRAVVTGARIAIEHAIVSPGSGEKFLLYTNAQLHRDDAGQPVRVVGTSMDVSGRVRAEAARLILERRLHETRRVEAVGRYAARISHDLRNLIGTMSNYSELLRISADSPMVYKEAIDGLFSTLRVARDLVDSMGSGSALGGKREPLNVGEIVRETAPLLRAAVAGRAELRIALANERCLIDGIRVDLERLLMNLVENAATAMKEGGAISIETRLSGSRSDGESPSRHQVELIVEDQGCGIPVEDRARVFAPYYTTKAGDAGSGMGLTIVAEIVRAHEGSIEIENGAHGGTRFVFRFPSLADRIDRGGMAVRAVRASRSEGARVRILVIDDDPGFLDSGVALLSSLGFEVATSSSGREALELVTKGARFDVVLTDLIMPGIDGFAVAETIHRRVPSMPVVITTGTNTRLDALPAGVVGVLDKPWSIQRVVELMDRLIESRSEVA